MQDLDAGWPTRGPWPTCSSNQGYTSSLRPSSCLHSLIHPSVLLLTMYSPRSTRLVTVPLWPYSVCTHTVGSSSTLPWGRGGEEGRGGEGRERTRGVDGIRGRAREGEGRAQAEASRRGEGREGEGVREGRGELWGA